MDYIKFRNNIERELKIRKNNMNKEIKKYQKKICDELREKSLSKNNIEKQLILYEFSENIIKKESFNVLEDIENSISEITQKQMIMKNEIKYVKNFNINVQNNINYFITIICDTIYKKIEYLFSYLNKSMLSKVLDIVNKLLYQTNETCNDIEKIRELLTKKDTEIIDLKNQINDMKNEFKNQIEENNKNHLLEIKNLKDEFKNQFDEMKQELNKSNNLCSNNENISNLNQLMEFKNKYSDDIIKIIDLYGNLIPYYKDHSQNEIILNKIDTIFDSKTYYDLYSSYKFIKYESKKDIVSFLFKNINFFKHLDIETLYLSGFGKQNLLIIENFDPKVFKNLKTIILSNSLYNCGIEYIKDKINELKSIYSIEIRQ